MEVSYRRSIIEKAMLEGGVEVTLCGNKTGSRKHRWAVV